jgi:hypothetical protein
MVSVLAISQGTLTLLRGNTYLWHVRVVIYKISMTNHIRQVVEASAPRWMFKGGMRDATREALAALRHDEDSQMEHS